MPRKCRVPGCYKTTSRNPKMSFFSLPKDPERRLTWLQLISREDLMDQEPHKHSICEMHFSHKFIMQGAVHNYLKKDSIPTLFLTVDANKHAQNYELLAKYAVPQELISNEKKTEIYKESEINTEISNIELESYATALAPYEMTLMETASNQEHIEEEQDESDTVNYFTDIRYEIPIDHVISNTQIEPYTTATSPSEMGLIQAKPIKKEKIDVKDDSDTDNYFTENHYKITTHPVISNVKTEPYKTAPSTPKMTLIDTKPIKQEIIEIQDESDMDNYFTENHYENTTHPVISNVKTEPYKTAPSTSKMTLIDTKPIKQEIIEIQDESDMDNYFIENHYKITTHPVISNVKTEPYKTAPSTSKITLIDKKPIKQEIIEIQDESDMGNYFTNHYKITTHPVISNVKTEPCTTASSPSKMTLIDTKPMKQEIIEIQDDIVNI